MAEVPYQQGSLRIRRRARGASVWELRYRITDAQGRRRLKQVIVGSLDQYPTEGEMRAKISGVILSINSRWPRAIKPMFDALVDRFIAEEHLQEIKAGQDGGVGAIRYSTAASYLQLITKHLRPRWQKTPLEAMRPAAVQEWLTRLPYSPKTKANIKTLLHRLFEKAMLWEAIDIQRNPMQLVEVKGISKRRRIPVVLTPDQFHAIVERLREPQRTMVIVAQCTGLRVSEILGLQWPDFDFEKSTIHITRGVVNGRVSRLKTEYSEDLLPLDSDLATVLLQWRAKSPPSPERWVFANPMTLKPYHASSIEHRYFRKIRASLGVYFGWHTFRHSYRSWLDATGAPVGVQQKLMRHAQVSTTMNVYGQALMESKKEANRKIVRLVLESRQAA